ncbi:MAG: cupin domain-containing protein [Chloroflexi bacterium]|nr:cupin domain-containing protein [Chloroflexota bacterium]
MQQYHQGNIVLIRANQRKKKVVPGNPMTYQALSPESSESLAMFVVTAAPNQTTGPMPLQHGGDENLLVLTGMFELEADGQKYSLGPGDCVFIPRGQRHRLTNVGTETGEGIFVISPPRY